MKRVHKSRTNVPSLSLRSCAVSTRFLLVLALDFLGALAAGRLESGTGDVGGSFRLAAGLVGVVGVGVENGVGKADTPFRGGV